jgi:molybdate transport system ATP-binding protein
MIDIVVDVTLEQGGFKLRVDERSRVEVLGLFGSSGSGKTTLLEAMAGLRRPSRGEIRVGDDVLFSSAQRIDRPPYERRLGYVPQEAALFPHLDVRENLLYGVRRADAGADVRNGRLTLDACAAMLEIDTLVDRRVRDLSGGERQRVAIGRALMTSPLLLLLDEPLAAVDRARRERILPYLLLIRRELHVPLIYVTHDEAELAQIADRVLVIENGQLVGVGPPQQVLARHNA